MFILPNEESEPIMGIAARRDTIHANRGAALKAFVAGERGYQ